MIPASSRIFNVISPVSLLSVFCIKCINYGNAAEEHFRIYKPSSVFETFRYVADFHGGVLIPLSVISILVIFSTRLSQYYYLLSQSVVIENTLFVF